MSKTQDLSRSLELKLIWTFYTEFSTIFNKKFTYITFKYAIKKRHGYPQRESCPPSIYINHLRIKTNPHFTMTEEKTSV